MLAAPRMNSPLNRKIEAMVAAKTASHAKGAAMARPSSAGWSKIEQVLRLVCEETGVSRKEILSARRARPICRARQIVSYLSRHHAAKSFPDIARHIGNQDHTSVLHGCRRIEELMSTDPSVRRVVDSVTVKLFALWKTAPVNSASSPKEARSKTSAPLVNGQNGGVEKRGISPNG